MPQRTDPSDPGNPNFTGLGGRALELARAFGIGERREKQILPFVAGGPRGQALRSR
ncbi:MAG: hypothetical protein ACJ796_23730 [Gemmatimonadaceae bacterium]